MSQPALRQSTPRPLTLPTEDDLPCDDGEPMETARHRQQMELLIQSLEPWARARGDAYVGGNMFLYFSAEQLRGKDFRGPDFFVVLGVSPRERKSWVVWDEDKGPDLIVELLSDSTRQTDKTEKMRAYQDRLRVAEYFWFDPWNPDDFAGFTLTDGRYRPLEPQAEGGLPSPVLGLCLVHWDGSFSGVETRWIRWATPDGDLLLTETEAAQAGARAAEAEAQRAQAEAQTSQAEARAAQAEARAAQARAQAEARRVQETEARAGKAEAEIARLRALLGSDGA